MFTVNIFFNPEIKHYICTVKDKQIIDAARTLITSKFIAWADNQDLNPVIVNKDDVFNVNRDDVELKVGKLILKFSDGKLVQ